MSPTSTTKIMSTRSRTASASETVPEIGESAQMLSEALKKYKKKRQEADTEDDEVYGEDEEQPTSPPGEEEDITAIQIWDEFMGTRINELPDTEYIKNVSALVGGRAADALAARAGLQLILDQENFVRDPEKDKNELRRKVNKLFT